ncbi:MAG: tyrosine-protein phosphatase [Clostridia bacterium]|jgi:protein-tyrosine phosphatase|nr:tyrosine-protein phosphatase [Clostridia bacterium]
MSNHNIVKLEKALNFRDLGGYESSLGGTVKSGKLFRSDSLANLSDADIDIIIGKGIRTAIDLRTDFETSRGENRLKSADGATYYNISLMDNVHSNDYASFEKKMPKSMKALYLDLLDNSAEAIIMIFDTILRRSANGVVFNCTAGKDRTGVIAALILDLMGVSHHNIVENYTATQQLMEPVFESVMKHYKDSTGREMPKYLLEARRESIVAFMSHLHNKYNGARDYLLDNGFGEEKIARFMNVYLERD